MLAFYPEAHIRFLNWLIGSSPHQTCKFAAYSLPSITSLPKLPKKVRRAWSSTDNVKRVLKQC